MMEDVKFQPIGHYILVKKIKEKEEDKITLSGVIVPVSAQKSNFELGVVVRLGISDHPFKVAIDDIVRFRKFSYDVIEIGGKSYLLMEEKSVLGIEL